MGRLAALGVLAALLLPAGTNSVGPLRRWPPCEESICPGDRDPQWSPDGKTIAFARAVSNGRNTSAAFQLELMDPDGRNVRAVGDPSSSPVTGVWSPDSRRLATGCCVLDVRMGKSTRII